MTAKYQNLMSEVDISFSGLFHSKCKYILFLWTIYARLSCNVKKSRNKYPSNSFQGCPLPHLYYILLPFLTVHSA